MLAPGIATVAGLADADAVVNPTSRQATTPTAPTKRPSRPKTAHGRTPVVAAPLGAPLKLAIMPSRLHPGIRLDAEDPDATAPPRQPGTGRKSLPLSRHLRYSLDRSARGTHLRVEDEVEFKGLGKLAAPIAARDIGKRWDTSLHNLKAAAEQQLWAPPAPHRFRRRCWP